MPSHVSSSSLSFSGVTKKSPLRFLKPVVALKYLWYDVDRKTIRLTDGCLQRYQPVHDIRGQIAKNLYMIWRAHRMGLRIRPDVEGEDESRARMAILLLWCLKKFGPLKNFVENFVEKK